MTDTRYRGIRVSERIRSRTTRDKGAHRDRPAPPSKSFCNHALALTKTRKKYIGTTSQHRARRAQARQGFPFSLLPVDCQLLVLSFLTEVEKCRAAMVCANWAELMRSPQLWRVANFVRVGSFHPGMPGMRAYPQQFERWQEWVYKYAFHLTSRCASLRVLRTCFILGDQMPKWTDFFLQFLEEVHCSEVQEMDFDWTMTNTISVGFFQSGRFGEMSLKMKEQFSSFLILVEKCIECSPKVSNIKLPFDWSEQAVELLISFKQLHTLELKRFWVSKAVSPKTVQFLTASLPNLKAFTLQITVPQRDFGIAYPLSSPSLKYLDVTGSQGFVFSILDLPALNELRVRSVRETMLFFPNDLAVQRQWYCLYDLLKRGTPSLQVLNAHVLFPHWQEASYRELGTVIQKACSCIRHNCIEEQHRGWADVYLQRPGAAHAMGEGGGL